MRHTARGIIIQNKKVLLVTGHGADFYWTPGGGIEPGETPEKTLKREIKEELGVEISKIKPYLSYEFANQKVDNFIIEIVGQIHVAAEVTDYVWFSSDLDTATSAGFKEKVLPKLLEQGLID